MPGNKYLMAASTGPMTFTKTTADESYVHSAPRNTGWTAFDAARDHSCMCGRYVPPDEAAMERAYKTVAGVAR